MGSCNDGRNEGCYGKGGGTRTETSSELFSNKAPDRLQRLSQLCLAKSRTLLLGKCRHPISGFAGSLSPRAQWHLNSALASF